MDLKGIDASLSAYVNAAWAETTQRTRSSQWSKFINFCHCHSLVPVPAGNMTVARFLVFLANTCTYSTCNNYLSAVVGLHRHLDAEQSFRDSYLISLVLKGIARVKGKRVSAKVGFTPEDLSCMFASLDVSDVNNTALWSALMLSFRSLLRKSNLVPDTTLVCQSVLKRADVEFTGKGVILHVNRSKTIQFKERVTSIPVHFVQKHGFCAASMLMSLFRRAPGPPESPLFYLWNTDGSRRLLLYRDLLMFVKRLAKVVGYDPSSVGCHSLRRSGAAFLHASGVPLLDIMTVGDWSSLAALSYLITPLHRKLQIEDSMCSVIDNYD